MHQKLLFSTCFLHPLTWHPLLNAQAGLAEGGITSPSPIQESAIPALLGGTNAAIQSYTGSGKVCVCVWCRLTD
jgi:hypothetical protein